MLSECEGLARIPVKDVDVGSIPRGSAKSAKLLKLNTLVGVKTATLSGWTVPPAKMSQNDGLFEVTGRL